MLDSSSAAISPRFSEPANPAHITALMRKDLERICAETGFGKPLFAYSGDGRIPKLTRWRWQDFLPFLRSRIFSDNFGMVVRK